MERYAFKMFLNQGMMAEYKRRHNEIWPELTSVLTESGIQNYSIYLDPDSHVLFATLERRADHTMMDLPSHPIMRRWWDHMKDLMRTHSDGEPVTIPLNEVFHMD